MLGRNREYIERSLEDIKSAVLPMARSVTELEAQTKNLAEGLERAFKAIDDTRSSTERMNTAVHASINENQQQTDKIVSDISARLTKAEETLIESRGVVKAARWLAASFGAFILGLIVSGAVWVHNETYSQRERLIKIEQQVEQQQEELDYYQPSEETKQK